MSGSSRFTLDTFAIFFLLVCIYLVVVSCSRSSDQSELRKVNSQDLLSEEELQKSQAVDQNESQHLDDIRNGVAHNHKVYYFGFDLRASPQEDAAQYLPFLQYLEKKTGLLFKLHFTPKNSTTADELGQGKSQFAAMGAGSFLYANEKYNAIPLVRGVNHKGKAEYQSAFVVKPESSIKKLQDIKNRRLAFGNRNSTQGHIIPRIMLSENGIALSDLKLYEYTGSHQNCVEAVISGRFDICGMQDQLAKKLSDEGQIRIVATSSYYPSSGIVANSFVHPDIVTKVQQALLEFEPLGRHRDGLYHWEQTEMPGGFTLAQKGDYAKLKDWSIRFGIINESFAQGR